MYELKEETKELIERIRRLDINAPMCCALLDLAAALEAVKAECEGWRMRLAACSTAALGNTPASVAARITRDSQYHSATYDDVCGVVDSEMRHRTRAERAEAALREYAQHKGFCGTWIGFDNCTCGLDAALAPASAQEGGKHAPLQPSACAGRAEGARP